MDAIDLPDEELVDETYVPVKKRIVAALSAGDATIKELAELTGAEVGTIRKQTLGTHGRGSGHRRLATVAVRSCIHWPKH